MTFDSLLINECDIQEFTVAPAPDDYGQPVKTWQIKDVDGVLYDDIPCRYVSGKGREVKVGQEVVIIYDEMYVGDITVTEQDRVIFDELTYQIVSVIPRQDGISGHHKHLFLEIVK